MLLKALSLWTKLFSRRRGHRGGPSVKRRVQLSLEPLEDRRVPVVGAFSIPAAISPDSWLGQRYDGVVKLSGCTGSLLTTGRHILTAAHCVDLNDDGREDSENRRVTFELSGGRSVQMTSTQVEVHPRFRGWPAIGTNGYDFAILTLPGPAPADADRYDIYRSSDEVGQSFYVVGYGGTGTGASGHDGNFGVKRAGWNTVDARDSVTARLFFDFDNGTIAMNWMGGFGLGSLEANTAPGDSGGPNFIAGKIAGVTMGGRDFWSRFGDVSYMARVSAAAPWIDSVLLGGLILDPWVPSSGSGIGSPLPARAAAVTPVAVEPPPPAPILNQPLKVEPPPPKPLESVGLIAVPDVAVSDQTSPLTAPRDAKTGSFAWLSPTNLGTGSVQGDPAPGPFGPTMPADYSDAPGGPDLFIPDNPDFGDDPCGKAAARLWREYVERFNDTPIGVSPAHLEYLQERAEICRRRGLPKYSEFEGEDRARAQETYALFIMLGHSEEEALAAGRKAGGRRR